MNKLIAGWRCRRGTSAVEFGFLAPILVMLLLGAYDFGRYGLSLMRVASAARAGVEYGMLDHSAANDIGGMTQNARDDAVDPNNELSIVARQFCRCPNGSEVVCSTTCGDGEYAPLFVAVTVSDTVDLLFDYPGVPGSMAVATTSEMRVR